MVERTVDFMMLIVAKTLLTDDDHWFQFKAMALGAKPFGLCAGQFHMIRSITAGGVKNAHGSTATLRITCRLQDVLAIRQDVSHDTI